MAASCIDPLDQFVGLTNTQRIEWLNNICVSQAMQINELKLQLQANREATGNLKNTFDNYVALQELKDAEQHGLR